MAVEETPNLWGEPLTIMNPDGNTAGADSQVVAGSEGLFMKHLEFIQGVINRMARNSFQLKAWSVTLTAAILALAANNSNGALALIAVLPGITFWGLDAYYLRLEKLYRALYDDVRENSQEVPVLSMDTRRYAPHVENWPRTLSSPSVFLFHGTVALVILVAIAVLSF